MTVKLKHCQQIIERRDFAKTKILQELVIIADYDPYEQTIEDAIVHLYENGTHIAEISKLLGKAEGDPLTAMINAIDWQTIYVQQTEMEVDALDEFEEKIS